MYTFYKYDLITFYKELPTIYEMKKKKKKNSRLKNQKQRKIIKETFQDEDEKIILVGGGRSEIGTELAAERS